MFTDELFIEIQDHLQNPLRLNLKEKKTHFGHNTQIKILIYL